MVTAYRSLPTYCFNYWNFERLGFTNYLPIPGEETHQGCVIYDPEHYEFEEVTAPVKYRVSLLEGYADYSPERTHTGMVLTDESIQAARKVEKSLVEKLRALAIEDKRNEFDETFNILCENNVCIFTEDSLENINQEVNPEKYTLLNLNDKENPNFRGIIIKKAALPIRAKSIELRVYRNSVAFAIGSKGKNAKKMAEALGVGHVSVVSKYY